jgi:multimeric flavodoxin WrbA
MSVKILAICCSPRIEGNTEFLLDKVLQGAKEEGAEVELYRTSGKNIKFCDACHACMKTGVCHIKDDMQEIYSKILESKGIIFGAPSYYYSMAGTAKTIIDRTTALNSPGRNMANKVGSVVAVGGSLGLADILKDIYLYYVSKQVIPANFVAGYGLQKGDVKSLENGIKACKDMGRQMVKIAAKGFEYPADIKGPVFGYGTWNK